MSAVRYRCPVCGRRVRTTVRYVGAMPAGTRRPIRHLDKAGRNCRGWVEDAEVSE